MRKAELFVAQVYLAPVSEIQSHAPLDLVSKFALPTVIYLYDGNRNQTMVHLNSFIQSAKEVKIRHPSVFFLYGDFRKPIVSNIATNFGLRVHTMPKMVFFKPKLGPSDPKTQLVYKQ